MENLYFPLFLVAVAIVVIWAFNKSRASSSRDRRSTRPTGRLADLEPPRRPRERPGPGARIQSGQGHSARGDIWQTRREKVNKGSFSADSQIGTYSASYLGPGPGEAKGARGRELKDQEVTEAEHLGIDEYLSKAERDKARARAEKAAKEEAGLSMTAMKYDPADSDSASEDEERKPGRRAGFKP